MAILLTRVITFDHYCKKSTLEILGNDSKTRQVTYIENWLIITTALLTPTVND